MTMIFVNTIKHAESLQGKLKKKNISAQILHGRVENAERDILMNSFRNQEFKALISTNVLARGVDVPEVDLVINFEVPSI